MITPYIYRLAVPLVLFILSFVSGFLWRNDLNLSVYKDREYWEKTGTVFWEAAVKEKYIALTFDDGPSPTFTNQILDVLALNGAKGTFFVVGKLAEVHPEIVVRESREGHEIGNHSYEHREINRLSPKDLQNDLFRAHEAIFRINGVNIKVYRPISGYYDAKVVQVAEMLHYKVIIWTWGLDSRDWTRTSGEAIASRVLTAIRPGSILLFHDQGGDRSNTIQALHIILPALRKQGYRFVTVSRLLDQAKQEMLQNQRFGGNALNPVSYGKSTIRRQR